MNKRGNLYAEAPEGQYKKHIGVVDEVINTTGTLIKLSCAFLAVASVSTDIPNPALALFMSASLYLAGAMTQTMAGASARENANQAEALRVHQETGRHVQPHPDRVLKNIARNLNPTALSI